MTELSVTSVAGPVVCARRRCRWMRFAGRGAAFVAVSVIGLELCLRVVLLNRLPILPFYIEQGRPALPASAHFTTWVEWHGASEYWTDAYGARVASRGKQNPASIQTGDIFVLGDSQALGYLMPFDQTFGSQLAKRVLGDAARVRILAAPGMDPVSELAALRGYQSAVNLRRPRLAVMVLNLGNDLDELFFAGLGGGERDTSSSTRWLMMHSRLFAEWISIHTIYFSRDGWTGVNPILYNLDAAERVFLARQAIGVLEQQAADLHRAHLNGAEHVAFVIVPAPFQVDSRLFERYRKNFASNQVFEEWNSRIDDFAGMMDALDRFIARQLCKDGFDCVQVSELARNDGPGAKWFVQDTDHLTAYGHEKVADALARLVFPPAAERR